LDAVSAMVEEVGQPFRFTAALANGQDLYAFRYAANDQSNSLYYRETAGEVLVVSEPIDSRYDTWTSVPDNSVLVARQGRPIECLDLIASHSVAAE
jgi:glutamine amidotransferase